MLEEIIEETDVIKILLVKELAKYKNVLDVTERKLQALIFTPNIKGNFNPQSIDVERVKLMNQGKTGKMFSKQYKSSKGKKIYIVITMNPEFILDYVVKEDGTYIRMIAYAQR